MSFTKLAHLYFKMYLDMQREYYFHLFTQSQQLNFNRDKNDMLKLAELFFFIIRKQQTTLSQLFAPSLSADNYIVLFLDLRRQL